MEDLFFRSDFLLWNTGEEGLLFSYFLVNEPILPICEWPKLTGTK